MHIAHVITKFDVGGAQTVVRDLAKLQVASGHTVTILCGTAGDAALQAEKDGASVIRLSSIIHEINPRADARAVKEVEALLRRTRPSVVHTHSSKGGLVGRVAANRAGFASVYTAHGWPFQRGAGTLQRVSSFAGEAVASRFGELVVCVSAAERDLAVRWRVAASDRIRIIPNGTLAIGLPRGTHRDVDDPFTVVMVARFAPPKRHDLVVAALRETSPNVRVVFVGDGPARADVIKMATDLRERITFASSDSARQWLAGADAFALISDYEGLPISILEAMSLGLPVVANRLASVAEALHDGECGVLVAKTPDEIARAFRQLAEKPEAAADLGAAALKRWRQFYRAEDMHEQYMHTYAEAMAIRA